MSPIKDKSVTFKIGNSTRGDIISKETLDKPGPGNYTGGDEFGKNANGFTFK